MRNIFEYTNNFGKYRHVKSILQYGDNELCQNPQVSVVMPVYGNPKFFTHSFNSVIHQDADFEYEVIVVDNTPLNANKSEVLKLIETANLPNVFYYRNEENIGMTGNWNRGIELARADLITFCHDDDMLYPDCLSKLWELHLKYPYKFIIPCQRNIDETVIYPLEDFPLKNLKGKECVPFRKLDIFMGNPTNGVGCLFYKKHMLELGGYNEEYYPSQDNALHVLYVFKYGAVYYRRSLYCYRITSNNTSNKVYKGFINNALFYGRCMAPLMRIPHFLQTMLLHALEVKQTNLMERVWGGRQDNAMKPTLCDKLVYKFLSCRNRLKNIGLL